MDIMTVFGKNYLIIVDFYFSELDPLLKNPSAASVIQ